MFEIRIQDERINAYRVIKGHNKYDVEAKAAAQIAIWNEKALRKQKMAEAEAKRDGLGHWEGAERAERFTKGAEANIQALEDLLSSLIAQSVPSWKDFKDHSCFSESLPKLPEPTPVPPSPSVDEYQPTLTLIDKLIPSRRRSKATIATEKFKTAVQRWQEAQKAIEQSNHDTESRFRNEKIEWQKGRDEFAARQESSNAMIDAFEKAYVEGKPYAIEFKINETLVRTHLPEGFPEGSEVSYSEQSRTLIVDFELPNQNILPEYREAKYVRTKSEIVYKTVSEAWKKGMYDSILYQSALGLIHRVFMTDDKAKIYSIVFNGWVQSVDKSTGADVHGCILSLQAGRDEFIPLDLRRVDPKACFRSLKGVASSKLSELIPIRPIQQICREDKRFIAGYTVVDSVDERTNLAAMDWQDFENLIREIFEKEFAKNGGEVKITQASRDGGVDAVAFDPDPIRGGKIVIQAKRYTNTVGVSAVRDLYGTVQHEGAMKGILVTTATYGSDAYEFAKDKPITLISGGELLTMLDRHGHAAKIDLNEARALRA